MRSLRACLALALALAAAPAAAYTIYLKDGSRIIARDKYEIRGELAIITLPSGTQSSLAAAEIDVARTEAANQSRLGGTAVVIEGGQAKDLQQAAPPAAKPRLQDLIRSQSAGLRGPPSAPPPAVETPAAALRSDRGAAPRRTPLGDPALANDILTFVAARGVTAASVHPGAQPRRPLLVFQTSSEGSVFKALVVSSNALLYLQNERAGAVEGFEVLCETPDGKLGGRFDLTPKLAADLVSGRYEITRFFVENVRF
jgi:hypothetical protein